MRRRGRTAAIIGLAGLLLLAAFACSLVPKEDLDGKWYIKLNVGPAAGSKAISVREYDVTGLTIVVNDPHGQDIQTIDWVPAEGQQTYLIPVDQAGQYELFVTHLGRRGTEEINVTESATFNIRAMTITTIDIVPGCIGQIGIDTGGAQPPENGTVTVSFTDADIANGHRVLVGVYPAGTDPTIDPMGQLVATGDFDIESGHGSQTLVEGLSGPDLWYGTGGESYDVYIWVDMNDNLEYGVYQPEPGIDLRLASSPVVVLIDGDMLLEYTGSDLVVVPPLQDGTITVHLTGAAAHNGKQFLCGVVITGDSLNNPANFVATSSGDLDQTIDDGEVEEIMVDTQVAPTEPKIFTGGVSYDAGGLIDVDGNLVPSAGDYMTTTVKSVVVDGNKTIDFTYPDDFGLLAGAP
jgi:hypothetical protein